MLQGRGGLVTGPAKGMGAAVTRTLAAAGADLLLVACDAAAVCLLAQEIEATGRRAAVVTCDITQERDSAAAMAVADSTFAGRIDFLVDIAGGSGWAITHARSPARTSWWMGAG